MTANRPTAFKAELLYVKSEFDCLFLCSGLFTLLSRGVSVAPLFPGDPA